MKNIFNRFLKSDAFDVVPLYFMFWAGNLLAEQDVFLRMIGPVFILLAIASQIYVVQYKDRK